MLWSKFRVAKTQLQLLLYTVLWYKISITKAQLQIQSKTHLLYLSHYYTPGEGGGTVVVDVTGRYASEWCTSTRRLRLRDSWWSESLSPFSPSHEEREREEEDIMSELS